MSNPKEWQRHRIIFPPDEDMDDELDRKIRRIEQSKKQHVNRGLGIRGT